MNKLNEIHQNVLQQELNDTSGVIDVKIIEKQKQENNNIREQAEKRIKNLMKRKKYSIQKEEDKELIDVHQEDEEYEIIDKKTSETTKWTTKDPENVPNYVVTKASSQYTKEEPIKIFNKIITDDVLKTIKKYTDERIDVEEMISDDMYYWKNYCKIFNDVYKELNKHEEIKQFICESSNIDYIKQLYSQLTNQNNLKKCFESIINSPKEYIMNGCVEIYHLEKLFAFKDNDKECEIFVKYFNKINELEQNKKKVRKIQQIKEIELKYYFGAIIYCGGNGYSNIRVAFKNDETLKYHTLSYRRFNEIGRCLRFDSYKERDQNSLTPIRYIIDIVDEGIKTIYNPSNTFTIDEHIIPFTGVFKYSVTIKDKPHSKGLRMDCLNDVETGYLYSFKIYAKSDEDNKENEAKNKNESEEKKETKEVKEQKKENEETQTIEMTQQTNELSQQKRIEETQFTQTVNETQNDEMKQSTQRKRRKQTKQTKEKKTKESKPKKSSKILLSQSTKYNYQYSMPEGEIAKTVKYLLRIFEMKQNTQRQNRINISMDNYYTTSEVIQYLMENDFGFCGTVRVLRSYIPGQFKKLNLQLYQSKQISNQQLTMTNYKAKQNKNVFLISNMIQQFKVGKGVKAKPGIVLLYNKTKGATDSYDHLISTCDVRRKSNRYQIAVLYDMINVLITDIFIIKRMENKKLDHRKFVISLGLKLLGLDSCKQNTSLCCCSFPTNINCKTTNHFFIMRTEYPHGTKHCYNTNCVVCNQCGNAIKPGALKQIVFDFCTECFNNINPPDNFKIFEKKSKHFRMENSDEIDNEDDEKENELEEKEQKERKRNHSELKN